MLCLKLFAAAGPKRRSMAHVIPRSVGGRLAVDCLCEECNAHLGDTFERFVPLDPGIRHAIEELHPSIPAIAKWRTLPGRRFIGMAGEAIVRVKLLPDGTYRLLPSEMPDGTRIKDAHEAEQEIRQRLEKANADAELVDRALAHFQAGGTVRFGEDVYKPRTGEIQVGLPMDEPIAPPEAFLGIGYLFLALGVEDAIYGDAFHEVRETLRADSAWTSAPSWTVEMGRVDKSYEPTHMIGFDSTAPPVVRVQLFRTFVWRVHLPAADRRPDCVFLFTDLDSGEESGVIADDDDVTRQS